MSNGRQLSSICAPRVKFHRGEVRSLGRTGGEVDSGEVRNVRRQEREGRTGTRCAERDLSACVTACVLHACMCQATACVLHACMCQATARFLTF